MAKSSGNIRSGGGVSGPQFDGTQNRNPQTEHLDNEDHRDQKERIKNIMMLTGVDHDKALLIDEAIQSWQSSSRAIRNYQKGRGGNDDVKRKAELINEFIEKSPKWAGSTTYRGVHDTGGRYSSLDIGDKYTENASSSWTTDLGTADFFMKEPVIMVCKSPQNGASISHLARTFGGERGEREVVTHSKNQYEVVGKEVKKGVTYIHVKPIKGK